MNVLSSVYNEIEYLYWHFQYNNKKLNRDKLLWPATCMLINKVSDDECQWNEHDVVISISGIFFLIERFVFSDLVAAISATLHETFIHSKYANSVFQFLLSMNANYLLYS